MYKNQLILKTKNDLINEGCNICDNKPYRFLIPVTHKVQGEIRKRYVYFCESCGYSRSSIYEKKDRIPKSILNTKVILENEHVNGICSCGRNNHNASTKMSILHLDNFCKYVGCRLCIEEILKETRGDISTNNLVEIIKMKLERSNRTFYL